MPLTAEEEVELLELLAIDPEAERVAPKLEAFRNPARIKVAYGGRAAGAKSWSFSSLLVQRAQREKINVLCTREIQLSLEESVYRLVINTIERLHYPGWYITKEFIQSPKKGRFYFRGLKDLRAAMAIKGLEDIDVAWVEEGAAVSHDSLNALFPTIRKPGSEIWVSFNREQEMDPVYERLVKNPRDDSMVVYLEPGPIDNPWWTPELQKEMEEDYKRDPDLAEHIWGGQPRSQGVRAIFSRTQIRGAMDRNISAVGAIEIGVDVARFGDDLTYMYKRKGLKVIDKRERKKQDTVKTADDAWDMAGHDPNIAIKVDDTGVGGGVTDNLRKLGANVIPINFGGKPKDEDKYTSTADEMWFEFPIDEADITSDSDLMIELSGRLYDYDNKSRKKIEPKKEYKKRNGKSPDHADALLLTFYNPDAYHVLQEPDWNASELGL